MKHRSLHLSHTSHHSPHVSSLLVISGEASRRPGGALLSLATNVQIKSVLFLALVSVVGGQIAQNDRKTLEGKGLSLKSEFLGTLLSQFSCVNTVQTWHLLFESSQSKCQSEVS